MATSRRLKGYAKQRPEAEVAMTRILTAVMAVALVAALFVDAGLAAANGRDNTGADRQGLMPEVAVTAEMPRLVMPTVEARASRTVAMSGSDLHVF